MSDARTGHSVVHDFEHAQFHRQRAHGGEHPIRVARVLERATGSGVAFIDLSEVPPGATIGMHRHGGDEEIYVIVSGSGQVTLDGDVYEVRPGSVVVNPPGGCHGLVNTGSEPLCMVVVDVECGSWSSEVGG